MISDGPTCWILHGSVRTDATVHPCGEDSNSMLSFFFGCARGPLRCIVMCNSFLSHDGMFVVLVERALTIFSSFIFFLYEYLTNFSDPSSMLLSPSPFRLLTARCSVLVVHLPSPASQSIPLMSYSTIKHSNSNVTYCNHPIASRTS